MYLLGEAILVPQVSLHPEGPITTPLTQTHTGGLLTLQTHSLSGGPIMTLMIWSCPELRVVKLHPLARLYSKGGWDPLTHHSPRPASMGRTLTFLHGNGNRRLILELRSSLILKVSAKKPLIQNFVLHGKNKIQDTRILTQICHCHRIDRGTGALTLTSLHPREDRGPNLLILISLLLEGVPVPGGRLHACILKQKLGW